MAPTFLKAYYTEVVELDSQSRARSERSERTLREFDVSRATPKGLHSLKGFVCCGTLSGFSL
jgi:hypothetical protein